jgi:BASS family bile acid:Na+ symporter
VDRLISILALVTVIEMMAYVGLSVSVADFLKTLRDARLVARGVVANYVLTPAVTLGLLLAFRPNPMVAVGFWILAVCPAGPYGPLYTKIARGNVGTAAGLMVILAGLSAVLSPLLLALAVRVLARERPVHVEVGKIVLTLLLGQALPLVIGLAVRHYRPRAADRLLGPAGHLTKVLNLGFLALVLYAQFRTLSEIHLRGFVGMAMLLVATAAVGWICGGADPGQRKAMTLTTAVRNNGVGMVIATASFAGTDAVGAAVVYGLVAFVGGLLMAVAWGRRTPDAPAGEAEMAGVGESRAP